MPSSRDLSDPGIKPTSLMSPALAGVFFTPSATWEAHFGVICKVNTANENFKDTNIIFWPN